MHAQLAHDAPFQVLHGLAVALDGDHARRQRRAVKRRQGGPAAKQAECHQQHEIANAPYRFVVNGKPGDRGG